MLPNARDMNADKELDVAITHTTSVHKCRICESLDRGLTISRNGSGIWFTVSEKPNESMGALGSSDRRNAQRMSATPIKIERFAMYWPGQALRKVASWSE